MKDKKRKSYLRMLITVITAVSMLFSLNGCSSSSGDDEPSFLEESEAPEALERTSIKFLFPGTEPKNWPNVKAEIEKRSQDKLNVSLDFKWVDPSQYLDTAKVLDSSGEAYDALPIGKPETIYPNFTQLAREGRIRDITEAFPSSAPSLYSMYTSEELKYATVDGKLYAVPSLFPQAFCTYLIADDELLKKYSIPTITTYDEYGEYLKTIKENEPDLIPGTIANMANTLSLFARASGYVIADEPNRLVYKWDDPEMKLVPWEKTSEFYDTITYIIDWYKKGYLAFDADQTKTTSFIYEGTLAPPSEETTKMAFTDSTGQIKESNPMRTFYLYPEKPVQRDHPMGSFFYNGSFVFPSASRNTDRALRFLEWVQSSRDNYLLMTCGIENEDYVMMGGYPVMPDGMDYESRTYMYWDGSWAFKNIRHDYADAVAADNDGAESPLEFLDKYSKYPPHGAFYPDYSLVQQIADDRQNTYMQFEYKLTQGQIQNMTDVDAFIKSLDELGTGNLVEEAQKQLTAGNK
jgi:putative aldouronate transport system substrate-binding protein